MQLDVMRRLDRYLGIPGCWVATLYLRLRRLLPRRRPQATTRVLVLQLAESGSMVLADPAMRELERVSADGLYVATFARNAESVAITGRVARERVFAIRTDRFLRLPLEVLRLARWARRQRVDTVVDMELFSRLSALLALACGAAQRVGFHPYHADGLYRGDLYTHPVAYSPHLHIAHNYLMLVHALTSEPYRPPAPRVRLDPEAALSVPLRRIEPEQRRRVRAALGERLPDWRPGVDRLVLINANGSALLPQRRWPEGHYVALARDLLARYAELTIALIGANEDGATTAAIAARVADARCVDAAGLVALSELPALFAESALLITNDSGPAHFAAVTDLPVLVLFGPETPRLYRPLGRNVRALSAGLACSPCVHAANQRRTTCDDNQCMQRLGVREVLGEAVAVLEHGAREARPA